LEEIVPLLRCPATMGKLRIESEQALVAVPGSRRWPVKNGRPIFFGSAEGGARISRLAPEQSNARCGNEAH
jgi:hypothetical protein